MAGFTAFYCGSEGNIIVRSLSFLSSTNQNTDWVNLYLNAVSSRSSGGIFKGSYGNVTKKWVNLCQTERTHVLGGNSSRNGKFQLQI